MPHHILARFLCLCAALATLSAATTSKALDTNLPPSGNFDLTAWKITLPDQTEIKEQQLSSGFESPDEFYTDPVTGGMVFKCPNDGQTGGSTYPRCELREMLRAGNTGISTTGIGLNNWVFSSSSVANQQASGGVDGVMIATLAVDNVSTTGSSSKVGRVIVGQIHASNDEPCRLYYRKLPGNTKGSIYIAHEPTTGSEQWYDMIGSRSSSAPDPADGIALGEVWSYEIRAVGDTLTVTIMRPGKPDVVQVVDMSASGFADDWMYFKAGSYNQNNEGGSSQYAQVTFFSLTHTHSSYGNLAPAFTSDPINELAGSDDAVYSSTLADDASDPESDVMTFSKVSGPGWLTVDADGTLSGTPSPGDVGTNVFTVQVEAFGGSNTATLNINVNASGNWVELRNDDFESGWGNYTSLGSDAQLSGNNAIGTQCVNLQDDTPGSIAILTNPLDLTGYSDLRIDFTYVVQSFEGSESFVVDYSETGGTPWTRLATYENDVDFVDDGTRYHPTIFINNSNYNFTANSKIYFQCDASADDDDVYIDNVVLYGRLSGTSNLPPAFTSDPINEINATEAAAYNSTIADDASDPEGDSMTFSKTSGPAWLTVAANGVLSGTPGMGDVATNVFTVQVDATGGSDTATLNITVDAALVNQPPSYTNDPINEISATEGVAYSSTIADDASDPEGDPMTFSKTSGPAWLSVAGNGALSGTPGAGDVGGNVFTVQVAAIGGSNTATLNITVNAAGGGGSITNCIVDDSWSSGTRTSPPNDASYWSSVDNGGNSIEVYANELGLISGTSGRGNHAIFPSQPLAVGETLIATLAFTTPATVGNNSSDALRFGFFDTTGHLPGLEADLEASSTNPNTNYNNLNGYMMTLDVVTGSDDVRLYERNNPGSGRLMATTGDYAELGNGPNDGYTFLANTSYTVEMVITRVAAAELSLVGSLYQGATLLSTHTESDTSATATEFGMLGMHANSSTFGSTTSAGQGVDNGLTFSNIQICHVTPAPTPPPTLGITLSGPNVILSWPTNDSSGFNLESSATMSTPSWSAAGSPTIVGDQYQLTLPATNSETYYRLQKP